MSTDQKLASKEIVGEDTAPFLKFLFESLNRPIEMNLCLTIDKVHGNQGAI